MFRGGDRKAANSRAVWVHNYIWLKKEKRKEGRERDGGQDEEFTEQSIH